MKDLVSKIEQEQDKQNISITELHTKMDLICKASNISNEKRDEEDRGSTVNG